MAHIGQEFGLRCVGVLGAVFLLGVFFRQIGKLGGLQFERLLRFAQIDDGGNLALFALDQFLLVLLDLGNIGSDRNKAAVLGAAFADMHPAPIVELRLERTRAARLGALIGDSGADEWLSPRGDDRFV